MAAASPSPALSALPPGPARAGGRRRPLGEVEITEPPGQGGDHPRPFLVVDPGDRLLDVTHWNGRTSIFRSQTFDASAASLSATSRSGASHTQTPARYSFDSTKGPSLNTACSPRLSMTVAVSGEPSPPARTQ